jgi:hypothetical protein
MFFTNLAVPDGMAHQAVQVGIARLKPQLRRVYHRHNRGGGSWRHRCGGRLRAPGRPHHTPPPIQLTDSRGRRSYSRRRRNNHLLLLCRTVDHRQQLAKPVRNNQRSQDVCLKGRIAAKVVAAELPKQAERLLEIKAVPGGTVGKNPVKKKKKKKPGQWVFLFFCFFYIFAQKRESLGFFQFQEYF